MVKGGVYLHVQVPMGPKVQPHLDCVTILRYDSYGQCAGSIIFHNVFYWVSVRNFLFWPQLNAKFKRGPRVSRMQILVFSTNHSLTIGKWYWSLATLPPFNLATLRTLTRITSLCGQCQTVSASAERNLKGAKVPLRMPRLEIILSKCHQALNLWWISRSWCWASELLLLCMRPVCIHYI